MPPKTLAHYQILAPLGSGAMGEVYRALDTRLGREVAQKTLPAEMAADPARLVAIPTKAVSQSEGRRSLVPADGGHRFRTKAATVGA